MPTGYTAEIGTNDNLTFKEFTLKCARAFGACIMQRDDNLDELPKKQNPSTYHVDELNKAIKKLEHFKKTPKAKLLKELKQELIEFNIKTKKSNKKYKKEKIELRNRYNKMLEHVNNWNCPTPEHEGLKKFMREQIEDSIRFDCGDYESSELSYTPEEFYKEKLKDLTCDIKHHEEGYNKEVELTNQRNKWITDLYQSLK